MAQNDRPSFGIRHVLMAVLIVAVASGLYRQVALALDFSTEEMFQMYVLLVFVISGGILGHFIYRRIERAARSAAQRGPRLRQPKDDDRKPFYAPQGLQRSFEESESEDFHMNCIIVAAVLTGMLAFFFVIPLATALIFGP